MAKLDKKLAEESNDASDTKKTSTVKTAPKKGATVKKVISKTEKTKPAKKVQRMTTQSKPSQKKRSPKPKKDDAAKSDKKPTTAAMVTKAFHVLKNRKGHTLAAIRKFIAVEFNCIVDKVFQLRIRKCLLEDFNNGIIKMVNFDGEKLNYTKRLALAK